MTWYLDKGLDQLRRQLKQLYPGVVIYDIGDKEHQERPSEHNPEADGSVDAIDVMIGPAFGPEDADWLTRALHTGRDERLLYWIWNRKICSSVTRPWEIRAFGGDPHTDHVHISVNDKHENDTRPWNLGGFRGMPGTNEGRDRIMFAGCEYGQSGLKIEQLQRGLMVAFPGCLPRYGADSEYGDETVEAVKRLAPGTDGRYVNAAYSIKLVGLIGKAFASGAVA